MRIIYGISGEGLGHAVRSSVIIAHLKKDHKIKVISTKKIKKFLEYDGITIFGMSLVISENRLRFVLTALENFLKIPLFVISFFRSLKLFLKFNPDVVITDFESSSAIISILLRKPIYSIDNIHAGLFAKYSAKGKFVNNLVTRLKTPFTKKIISSFFIDNSFPPILRNFSSKKGNKILVYVRPENLKEGFLKLLQSYNEQFLVYGTGNGIFENVELRKYDDRFQRELEKSKAVITSGGFTLMTEAMMLNKPVLSIPIEGHFEQQMNAYYLEKLGHGLKGELNKETLDKFFKFQPKKYVWEKNDKLFNYLNGELKKWKE